MRNESTRLLVAPPTRRLRNFNGDVTSAAAKPEDWDKVVRNLTITRLVVTGRLFGWRLNWWFEAVWKLNKKLRCRQSESAVLSMSEGERPTSGHGEKSIFQSDYSFIHAILTLLSNATMKSKIRYGNLAHVRNACRQQLCVQRCGKPRQIETWLLLTLDTRRCIFLHFLSILSNFVWEVRNFCWYQ